MWPVFVPAANTERPIGSKATALTAAHASEAACVLAMAAEGARRSHSRTQRSCQRTHRRTHRTDRLVSTGRQQLSRPGSAVGRGEGVRTREADMNRSDSVGCQRTVHTACECRSNTPEGCGECTKSQ